MAIAAMNKADREDTGADIVGMELLPSAATDRRARSEARRFDYNNANGRIHQARDLTMTIERLHVGKRLSGLVIHHASGTAYLAGQVAEDTSADVSGQTRDVLAQIDALLREAGSDKSKILSATIFLPDMADFAAMNAVWEQWVVPGQTPARATVEAKLASPKYRVEIQVVAATAVRA